MNGVQPSTINTGLSANIIPLHFVCNFALKALVEEMESKLMEPLSEQVVAEMQEREDEVKRSDEASRARYDQLVQSVKASKAQG